MSENASKEILRLIQETDDQQAKAILLILFEISSVLKENTAAIEMIVENTERYRTDFLSHIESYNQQEAAKKGVKSFIGKWAIPIFSLFQALFVILLTNVLDSITDFEARLASIERTIAVMQTYIK